MLDLRIANFRLTQIKITSKILFTFIGNCIVITLSRNNSNKFLFFEFSQSSCYCFIRNIYISISKIIGDPLVVVSGSRIRQKLQNYVITTGHPIRPLPSHCIVTEEPSKTIFDRIGYVHMIIYIVQILPQTLSNVGKSLDITIGAVSGKRGLLRGKRGFATTHVPSTGAASVGSTTVCNPTTDGRKKIVFGRRRPQPEPPPAASLSTSCSARSGLARTAR